jgi:hypothetical protein
MGSHAAVAAELSQDKQLVQQVLEDFENSPLDEKHKVLFRYIEKLNKDASSIAQDDIAGLKSAGWSEEAIYDALSVAALFKFYNTWIDGSGVSDMSAHDYALGGKNLASMGYLMDMAPSSILEILKSRHRNRKR